MPNAPPNSSSRALLLLGLSLGLTLGMASSAAAKDQRLRGSIDLDNAVGALTPPTAGQPLRLTFAGYSGTATRTGKRMYRAVLTKRVVTRAGVGAAGRLRGETGASGPRAEIKRIVITLDQEGKRGKAHVHGHVFRDGALVGRLQSDPCDCRTKRDRWWSRHAVAGWGAARTAWDFFKPGSRRLEELRGPVTRAQTQELKRFLDSYGSAPLTPTRIFRAARLKSRTDQDALRLAFALVVDERALKLQQIVGIPASAPIHDKYEHFFASAIMAHRSNAAGSFGVGWAKEVLDEIARDGTGYDENDLVADALGADFGQALLEGRVP